MVAYSIGAYDMLNWMAWTLPTALFFVGIGLILVIMTVYEVIRPCQPRKGFLPIATTRGDRLFISLLASGFIHLAVIGSSDLSIWFGFGLSLAVLTITMRWG